MGIWISYRLIIRIAKYLGYENDGNANPTWAHAHVSSNSMTINICICCRYGRGWGYGHLIGWGNYATKYLGMRMMVMQTLRGRVDECNSSKFSK